MVIKFSEYFWIKCCISEVLKATKFIIVLLFTPGMKSVIFFVCAAICILPGGKSKLHSDKLCVILLIYYLMFCCLC